MKALTFIMQLFGLFDVSDPPRPIYRVDVELIAPVYPTDSVPDYCSCDPKPGETFPPKSGDS